MTFTKKLFAVFIFMFFAAGCFAQEAVSNDTTYTIVLNGNFQGISTGNKLKSVSLINPTAYTCKISFKQQAKDTTKFTPCLPGIPMYFFNQNTDSAFVKGRAGDTIYIILRFSQGVNIGSGFRMKQGTTFSVNASQYFARYDAKPGNDTLKWYAEFIDSLVLNGCWDLIDDAWILANNTSSNALIGIKGYKNCTAVNSPAFVPYAGFLSNGTTSYINTGYIPGTHGVALTTNSISFGVYSRKDTADDKPAIGLTVNAPTTSVMYLYPKYTDNKFYYSPNTVSGNIGVAIPNSLGLIGANRKASDSVQAYHRGTLIGSAAAASTFLISTLPMLICTTNKPTGIPTDFTKRQIAFAWVGGSMTPQQHLNFYNCLQRLLTKIGANV